MNNESRKQMVADARSLEFNAWKYRWRQSTHGMWSRTKKLMSFDKFLFFIYVMARKTGNLPRVSIKINRRAA